MNKLKTCVLKNGAKIQYDRVTTIEGSHHNEKITLHQFARGTLGIVAVVPAEHVEKLDA